MKTIPSPDAQESLRADLANVQALTVHYPIKKKRQPRQLRPNLEAIRYLEIEAEHATTIFEEQVRNNGEDQLDDLTILRANGWYDAKRANMYPRAMFDLFFMGASSSVQMRYAKPCPACDDWSRTAQCATHPDEGTEGLKRGPERRSQMADQATAYYSEPVERPTPMQRVMQEMFERTLNYGTSRCTCNLCQTMGVAPSPVPLGPTRRDFLANLPSGSITLDNPTIEVNGETLQGVRSFTIHIEGDRSD